MAERHLIVLSVDAMVDADLEYASRLPHFARFLSKAAQVRHVESIYPSVTYPAHVTMASGCYPDKTGVWSNEELIPGNLHPAWHWFHDCVRVPDLFDAAHAAGLTTAGVFWPVTGNHPSIDYLIDEYWPQSSEESKYEALALAGASREIVEKVLWPYLKDVTIRTHPQTDIFCIRAASELIRMYKPNLLMIHPADVDGARHATGVFSKEVEQSLRNTDEYIGWLMDAAEEAGIYDDTDWVVMSDHGQMNITRVMCLNALLADKGYIKVNADGSMGEWRAYVKSCGMSAHVYVRDRKDVPEIEALLRGLVREEVYGVSEMLTADEALERFHLAGDFDFVLETDGFTAFGDSWVRPLMRPFDNTDYRHGRATHGYMPQKGPQPVFLCAGPHVRRGVTIERGKLVDAAPTMAKLLGVELPEAQGTAWDLLVRG